MAEHTVQDIEHGPNGHVAAPIPTTPSTTPAPMVERAFRLLDLLSVSEAGMTLSELARALDISKSTLHGLLKTLEAAGAIASADHRRYVLGWRIHALAAADTQHAGLLRHAVPAMRRVAASIGETIFLGRAETDAVRIVERVEARPEQPALRISAARGTRVHLLAGATGRLVLASWPEERRIAYLRTHPLPRFTASSITDPARYLAAVASASHSGIGEDREEYLAGVNAVAAPIYSPDGSLLALLWAVGFAAHFDGAAFEHAGYQLRDEAASISRALGSG